MISFFRAVDSMGMTARYLTYEKDSLIGALSSFDITQNKIPSRKIFCHSENVFNELNHYLKNTKLHSNDAMKFPVVDTQGNLMYLL